MSRTIDCGNVSRILPTFFRGVIARARMASGPEGTYESAAYHLAINIRSCVEGDLNDARVAELDVIAADQDADALLAWMTRSIPRCIAEVPARRRRTTFLRGLARALEDERV